MIFDGNVIKTNRPDFIAKFRETYKGKNLDKLIDSYYENNTFIEKNFNENSIKKLIQVIQSNLALTEPFIEYWIKEDGRFQNLTLPAIEKGLILFSVLQYKGQLINIKEIVDCFEQLHYYTEDVKEAFVRLETTTEMISRLQISDLTIKDLQTDFDKQVIHDTAFNLNRLNMLERIKIKGTYLLKLNKNDSPRIDFESD